MKKHPLEPSVALYSAEQIRNIEQNYLASKGVDSFTLMRRAGSKIYATLTNKWPSTRHLIIFVGKGNNAGDGLVVARIAAEQRLRVTLCFVDSHDKLQDDALRAYNELPRQVINEVDINEIDFSEHDLIIDAMLGTGAKGRLKGAFSVAVKKINSNNLPVLSIDIPTGVEADTGFVCTDAVKADITVTFVGHKKGMYTGQSANYRGNVYLEKLGIDNPFFENDSFHLFSQNWHSLKYRLKPRINACHKGLFGHTVVIGGYTGMSGAAILASTAAAKSGSGLTSAWVANECAGALVTYTPEVMAVGVAEDQIEVQFNSLLKSNHVFVIGPGLAQSHWSQKWLITLSEHPVLKDRPQVWDADALNWLATLDESDPRRYNPHRILTPHPGEAARLLATNTYSVEEDRFFVAQKIADTYGGVCVLKGNGTIIAHEKGFQVVCPVGNPGMASGGIGDVLAGIIGGLLAQDFSLMDAAMLGVCIHGEAADKAAGRGGYYRGLMASDLFAHLPPLLNPAISKH